MRFTDIPGHESVKDRLRAMVAADRIPHALLLEGPEGIGKLAMARAFAQYVHCQNRTPEGEPCGECQACRLHESNNHPDLFYAFPIFKRKSDSESYCEEFLDEWHEFLSFDMYADFDTWVRILNPGTKQPIIYNSEGNAILRKVSVKSYASRYKIMIMWLPEKMKEECANRLLKMIEEPYDDTLLLFVSNNPQDILPTIYSRVQRVKMKRLPGELIERYLVDRYATEPQTAKAMAHMAEGSMTAAVGLLDVETDNVEFLDYYRKLMRQAYMRDVRGLKIWSEEVADFKRERCGSFLEFLARMIRESFIYNLGNRELNYMTREEEAFNSKFCPFVNERNVSAIINETDRAALDISRNANAKIVLFDYAIKMIVALRM